MAKLKLILLASLIASVGIITSGCGREIAGEESEQAAKRVAVQTIEQQNQVSNTITVSGTAVPKQYSVIRSLTPGTVEYLAPVGSPIFAGQQLFSIHDSGVEDVYFNAQRSLDQTKAIGAQRVTQAELAVRSAEAELTLARASFDIAERQADQNIETSLNAAMLAYRSAYNGLNQTLVGLSHGSLRSTTYGYVYEDIPTSETQIRSDASTQLSRSVGVFVALSPDTSEETLHADLESMRQALVEVKRLTDMTAILLQAAISGPGLPQATLETYRVQAASDQTSINAFADRIVASQNSLSGTDLQSALVVDQARNQMNLAAIRRDNTQIALDSAREGAALEENSAQRQFDAAAYNYRNLFLPSPFSGTVLSHYVSAGEQVSAGREIIEIGNVSLIEVVVEIDAGLAQGLKLGDAATIDDAIDAVITEIEPAGDLSSGKVGLVVQAENADHALLSGTIVDVSLTLNFQVNGAVVIPIRAATIEETGTTVFLIEDGRVARRPVTLGRVFGDRVVVESGLSEGDQLILPNGVFVSVGEQVEPNE